MTLKVKQLKLPETLPTPEAMKSLTENKHNYEAVFWELQYEEYRYLERVEDEVLDKRYLATLRNLKSLVSPDRHVIPIISNLSSWYWYRKEHQARLEYHLRKRELPTTPPAGIIDNTPRNAPAQPRCPNAGDVLFKYGEIQHMEEMLETGKIRISPADYYKEFEGDLARLDDERNKHSYLPGAHTKVTTSDGQEIPIIGDFQQTVSGPNYYAFCLSCNWDPKLFIDFDSDACVVIKDVEAFSNRMERALSTQLSGWYFHHNPVQYYDPYEMRKNEYMSHAMSKDFQFAYQREYRFIWEHLGGIDASGFIYISLGSLADIAELHKAP